MPLDSFVDIPPNSDFPLDNLPWGVFQRRCQDGPPAIGVALGDMVVDVAALQQLGLLSGPGLSGAGGACLQEVSSPAIDTHWQHMLGTYKF
jgi:fumarylacetoacetase